MRQRVAWVLLALAMTLASGVGCSTGINRTSSRVPTTHAGDAAVSSLPTLETGATLAAGERRKFGIGTHCGVRVLSRPVNDVFWRTDEATGPGDWTPAEWQRGRKPGEQLLTIEIELSETIDRLTASYAGRAVQYRPTKAGDPPFLCM